MGCFELYPVSISLQTPSIPQAALKAKQSTRDQSHEAYCNFPLSLKPAAARLSPVGLLIDTHDRGAGIIAVLLCLVGIWFEDSNRVL